jgi:acetyltransferase-like isoleucine patch superfamily enzyme
MSLRTLIKLMSLNRYPRYFREYWLRYSTRQAIKAIQEKILQSGGSVSASVVFNGIPIISIAMESRIEIGENTVLCSDSIMTALGVNHPVVLRTLRPGATIIIGRDTGISGGAICAAIRVKIGNECLIGANVVIADTDFHPHNPIGRRYNNNPREIAADPVEIEDNVFIGTGTIILKGVKVGANSVIGAGSVVTKNVPPNSVAAGNPAKILRSV